MSWRSLLSIEQTILHQLEAASNQSQHTLLTGLKPNPGGQSLFWDLNPLTTNDPKEWRWFGLIGGIGSGKSFTGCAWAVSRALLEPEARGLIAANTFGQLSRATLVTLVEVCRMFGVPLEPYRESVEDHALAIANAQRCYIGEKRAFAYVLSMGGFTGKTQAARGLQCRWVLGDEWAFAPEQSFLTIDGRLGRGPGKMKGIGLICTSPNGYNWLYDRFADPQRGEDKERLYRMVSLKTIENVFHLGEDYVSGLYSNYAAELQQQELEGVFVNSCIGRIYKYFDRKSHALQGTEVELLDYDRNLPLHVSFDFNRSPAICLLAQVRGSEIHIFKEFYIMDSDTWELSDEVTGWISSHQHLSDIFVYGDATGIARTAASRLSNWDIVFDAFRNIGYSLTQGGRLHKRFESVNPPVTNRINSVNCLFSSNRLFVNFEQCKQLVKDFEVLTWSGEGIDKSDILRSHLSDAAGYLVHKVFPYKAESHRRMSGGRKPKGVAT